MDSGRFESLTTGISISYVNNAGDKFDLLCYKPILRIMYYSIEYDNKEICLS